MSNLLDVVEFREWLAKQPANENANILWLDCCPIARFIRLKHGLKPEDKVLVSFDDLQFTQDGIKKVTSIPAPLREVIQDLGKLRPGQDDPFTSVTNGQVLEALDKALEC